MKRMWIIACGMVALAGFATAADPAPEKTGIKVGEKAPEFTLKDQSGQEHSLKDLRKDQMVALVFYRSASW